MSNIRLLIGPPNTGKTTRAIQMAGDGAWLFTPEPHSAEHAGQKTGIDYT